MVTLKINNKEGIKMFSWIKKLRKIVSSYDSDFAMYAANLKYAQARITELEQLVKDRTNIAVDLGFRSANHVIVVGRYKNADYVQTFQINGQLNDIVDRLREMEKYGEVRRVDGPPAVRAVFNRELNHRF